MKAPRGPRRGRQDKNKGVCEHGGVSYRGWGQKVNSWRMNYVGSHIQIMKILGVDLYVFLTFLLCLSIAMKTIHCVVIQQHCQGGNKNLWKVGPNGTSLKYACNMDHGTQISSSSSLSTQPASYEVSTFAPPHDTITASYFPTGSRPWEPS